MSVNVLSISSAMALYFSRSLTRSSEIAVSRLVKQVNLFQILKCSKSYFINSKISIFLRIREGDENTKTRI
jgi:hypothetical protein